MPLCNELFDLDGCGYKAEPEAGQAQAALSELSGASLQTADKPTAQETQDVKTDLPQTITACAMTPH